MRKNAKKGDSGRVAIFMAYADPDRYEKTIGSCRKFLPGPLLAKAKSFRLSADACRFILGKVLLLKGTRLLGYEGLELEGLRQDKFHRPCWPDGPEFNISHSGPYVLCAIGHKNRIGIDIEEIRKVDINAYANCFTIREWSAINGSDRPVESFYRLWTRKEAVIKADGRGMQIPLPSFEVLKNRTTVDARAWYMQELKIAEGYCAHLATHTKIQYDLCIRRIL
jgi:4'-phosphopantetheinyl transferase